MKAKLAITLGCIGVLLSSYVLAGGCIPAGPCKTLPPPPPNYICGGTYGNCTCTDPGCRGSNNCLSRGTCCKAFGNVGGIDDDMPIPMKYYE